MHFDSSSDDRVAQFVHLHGRVPFFEAQRQRKPQHFPTGVSRQPYESNPAWATPLLCLFPLPIPSLSPLSPPSASFLPPPCPLCLCVSKPLFKTQRHKVHRVSYKSLSPNPENPIRLGGPPSISFPPPYPLYPLYPLPLLLSYLSVPSVPPCFKTHSKPQMETLPGYENPKPHVDSKPSPPSPWDSTDPCSD